DEPDNGRACSTTENEDALGEHNERRVKVAVKRERRHQPVQSPVSYAAALDGSIKQNVGQDRQSTQRRVGSRFLGEEHVIAVDGQQRRGRQARASRVEATAE